MSNDTETRLVIESELTRRGLIPEQAALAASTLAQEFTRSPGGRPVHVSGRSVPEVVAAYVEPLRPVPAPVVTFNDRLKDFVKTLNPKPDSPFPG